MVRSEERESCMVDLPCSNADQIIGVGQQIHNRCVASYGEIEDD